MRTVVPLLPHDLAVIAALETIGKPVGFAEAPDGALEAVQGRSGPDYMVLYPLNTVSDGSLGDPNTDVDLVYQVTCVGRLAAGVRWLMDRIEPALWSVSIPDRAVFDLEVDAGTIRADQDLSPTVFLATPRITLSTVPA